MLEWNAHAVRTCRQSMCPAGRPEVLYNFPAIYGSLNYLTMVEARHIENCGEECLFLNCLCTDKDVFDLCEIFVAQKALLKSTDVFDAVNLYITLRNEILAVL